METTNTTLGEADDPSFKISAQELKKRITTYLIDRGVGHFCEVSVNQQGRFYELSGCVDSFWTRSVLFSLVPKQRGRRYIIDKLQVVSGLDSGRALA